MALYVEDAFGKLRAASDPRFVYHLVLKTLFDFHAKPWNQKATPALDVVDIGMATGLSRADVRRGAKWALGKKLIKGDEKTGYRIAPAGIKYVLARGSSARDH